MYEGSPEDEIEKEQQKVTNGKLQPDFKKIYEQQELKNQENMKYDDYF